VREGKGMEKGGKEGKGEWEGGGRKGRGKVASWAFGGWTPLPRPEKVTGTDCCVTPLH